MASIEGIKAAAGKNAGKKVEGGGKKKKALKICIETRPDPTAERVPVPKPETIAKPLANKDAPKRPRGRAPAVKEEDQAEVLSLNFQ